MEVTSSSAALSAIHGQFTTTATTGTTATFVANRTVSALAVVQCVEHDLDEDSVELIDGRISGACSLCGDAMTMGRVAGGLPLLQIRMLMYFLALAHDGLTLPDDVMAQYIETKVSLRDEAEAIAAAQSAFDKVTESLFLYLGNKGG